VGKSSLLNVLFPELNLETGTLARRTDRGRHTTRHAQLWPYQTGAVFDTPGFSLFDLSMIDQDTLNRCYREFALAEYPCRFPGCSHRSEPDCAIKELVQAGMLSKGRYARYIQLATQFEEMRKRQYD